MQSSKLILSTNGLNLSQSAVDTSNSKILIPKSKWIADEKANSCFNCNSDFIFFIKRRHHCRMCGQVFCSKCSNNFLEPALLGISHEEKSIRFCEYCYKIVARIIGLNSKSEIRESSPTFGDESQEVLGISQNIFMHYPESSNSSFLSDSGDLVQKVATKIEMITEYLFKRYNLYDKYYKLLVEKVKKASTGIIINTLVYEDPMNINEYVKIKKIVFQNESECKYIWGVVCSKNISHRKMKGNFKEPKILIINPSLEIPHCKRDDLTYFDDLKENEDKFIKQSIATIMKISPNIIMVEQSINGKIQNYLYTHEILYVQKVKSKLLKRIARATQGQIFGDIIKANKATVESNLGKCKNFFVRTFYEPGNSNEVKGKDLMYIEGCKEGYAATITISGPDINELIILKKCLKHILVRARHLHLEKELVNLERSFDGNNKSSEINTHGNFKTFIDEKIPLKELIDCTKIFCIKINLVEVPLEFFHDLASLNEKFVENIHTFIQNNMSRLKVPFLAVMCGNPMQKCHEFYSDEVGGEENPQDTTLGNYIKLRVNSLFTKCSSCKRPRYRHVIVYYYRNTYLKVTAELIGVTKALALRKEEDTMRSLIIDKTPKAKASDVDWKLDNYEAIDSKLDTKSPSNIRPNSGASPKTPIIGNEKDSKELTFNAIGNKLASIFTKTHLGSMMEGNTPKDGGSDKESQELKGKQQQAYNREQNKRTIIQTYIECQKCNEKLSSVRDLQILYLEYSFSEFLRHFFINDFSKDVDWNEMEKSYEKNECPHYLKCRVFKLDEFLVKFYGGQNKLYSIKNYSHSDEIIQNELKAARDEKVTTEKSVELKEKITILIKFLKNQITEKKSAIRKPRLRSSLLNTQSFNPENLTSPLKKKDLIILINELNGIYKGLDTFYNDLIVKLSKATNYLEVEYNRMKSFYFFVGVLQKLNYIDECMPKEVKEEEEDHTRFTFNNLKRIFTFKQESFSPTETNGQHSANHLEKEKMKNVLSEEMARNDCGDVMVLKTESFSAGLRKINDVKPVRGTSKLLKNEPLTSNRLPTIVSHPTRKRAKSCPIIMIEKNKFPLFLSEDEIRIPPKMMMSMFKESKQSFNNNTHLRPLRYDGNSKTMSEEPKSQNEFARTPQKVGDSEKKEKLFINLEENSNSNNKYEGESAKDDEIEEKSEESEKTESCSQNSGDAKTEEEKSDSEEIFKHFNPNNLLKSKKFRKGSSTSVNDSPEFLILMDLMKGMAEWEPENEFKATKFYKFLPIIKSQPLSVIAYAMNSMKYFKEIYIKEGFYEQSKFLKGRADEIVHLTNFIKMKLYHNECVEKNDEFLIQTNILEIKKEKLGYGYRYSYHNLEKLQVDEESRLKFRKNTAFVSSFDENEEIFNLLAPCNKVKILIYYPRQFEALRMSQNICLGDFIKSLALSNPWSDNTGGKSNASFIKTYDDLYVFKNLRNNEFKMFKSYAIEFFKYMFKVGFEKKKKSFLARIYGMFEVHIDSERYYYIAMENLFFGLDPTTNLKIYDLKGSETNRYVPNSRGNQVLFDTNFKIDQNGEPLSLLDQDKQYLSEAIENDTKFLNKHNLIDYSLLLIIDNKNSLIKVGIIDYLRLFTWDKQVESIGKKMIKAGATPTIIKAAEYSKRFQEAMNKYFMGIPN